MPRYLRCCFTYTRFTCLGVTLFFSCTAFLLQRSLVGQHDQTISNINYIKRNFHKPLPTKALSKNERELLRFKSLLGTWPKDKPKAAIHYLLGNRYIHINRSLNALHTFFNKKYRYPIIIFHERDFDTSKIMEIGQTLSSELIFFQEIEFKVPEFFKEPVPEKIPCMKPIGYRHMCRFHSKTVYDQPIMQDLEYGWRLDDDSFILANVTYDLFRYMKAKDILYGYTGTLHDPPNCAIGLYDAVLSYANRTNRAQYLKSWPKYLTYYNNFEISAMSVWRSKDYIEYFDYIDRLGGIYWFRWGDAPIKTFGVRMFVPASKVHQFKDIFYHHVFFKRLPKD